MKTIIMIVFISLSALAIECIPEDTYVGKKILLGQCVEVYNSIDRFLVYDIYSRSCMEVKSIKFQACDGYFDVWLLSEYLLRGRHLIEK